MKFNEAFEKAFDDERKKNKDFSVSSDTAKILAFIWNMQVAANFVLDDNVHIDNNNNIISIPLKESNDVKKTKAKAKSDKTSK